MTPKPSLLSTQKLLGKRPLLVGEDSAQYDWLVLNIVCEINPTSIFEHLLIKDIADAEWELLRLYAFKANMVNAHLPGTLLSDKWYGQLNIPMDSVSRARGLLHRVLAGEQAAHQQLEELLGQFSLTLEEVSAAAFDRNIMSQLHADRMIGAALMRRNAAYLELERLAAKRKAKPAKPPETASAATESDAATQMEAPPAPALRSAYETRPKINGGSQS